MRNVLRTKAKALGSVLFKSSFGYLIAQEFNFSIFIVLSVYWPMGKERFHVTFSCVITFVSVVFFTLLPLYRYQPIHGVRTTSSKTSNWILCTLFADIFSPSVLRIVFCWRETLLFPWKKI